MMVSATLTNQKLKEILTNIYLKGQESKHINVIELIEEIKDRSY